MNFEDEGQGRKLNNVRNQIKWSMECSSMVSVAAFGLGDPGSNPGWFAVSNSNRKLSFHKKYKHVVLSFKDCLQQSNL